PLTQHPSPQPRRRERTPSPKIVDVSPEGPNSVIIKLTFPYGVNGLRAYKPSSQRELSEFTAFRDAIPEYAYPSNIHQGKDEIQVKILEEGSGYVRPKRNEEEDKDAEDKKDTEEDEEGEAEKDSILKKLTDFAELN
ncbi:Uncharacterized protein FKW44_015659, partial [Caligus rogercresseyi]